MTCQRRVGTEKVSKRSVFTKKFKERVVELALKTNRKRSGTARELGITGNTLARWIREMKRSERGAVKDLSAEE
ncbi:MAG: transposase [Treponema sp.]|nr:transposase [Treponema sp.]